MYLTNLKSKQSILSHRTYLIGSDKIIVTTITVHKLTIKFLKWKYTEII